MTRQGWNNILRGAGVAMGLALMIASWYFSASYFGIKKPELTWLGWMVAIVVTFAEFAWRKEGLSDNTTFKVIGFVCYAYDIITNTLGVEEAWGITGNYLSDPMSLIMAAFVGFIFAVIAEPMLSWGITGNAQADLISGVIKAVNGDNTPDGGGFGGGSNNHGNNNQNQPKHGGNNNQNRGGRPEPNFHPSMSGSHQNPNSGPMGRNFRQGQQGKNNNHQAPKGMPFSMSGGPIDMSNDSEDEDIFGN